MKKVLFFDIDGTLVSFNTHTVPDSTVKALRAAHEKGHKIIIATGRPLPIINNLGPLMEEKLIDGYITMNGAYCVIGGKVVDKHAIPAEEVKKLIEVCRRNGYPCVYVGENDIKGANPDEEARRVYENFLAVDNIPLCDYDDGMKEELYQMTPFFGVEEEKKIRAELPGCEFNRWYPTFVDITAHGVNKAAGIDVILRELGMPLETSVAFGDGGNDMPMLKHAAVGVAMGNADDTVKASADYVTTSVDDNGIVNALRHLDIID